MRYSKTLNLIATSIIASSILVGCSGTTATDTTNSGVAVDPELQGATVFLDINKNGTLDAGEPSTTTDSTGAYSLVMDEANVGAPILVTGGIDLVTKENFTGVLSVISEAGNANLHITPLTTLVYHTQLANPTLDINSVKASVANQLGINSEDLDDNIVEPGKENLLKLALRVQKMAQGIVDSNSSNTTIEDVYSDIAGYLKDANLTTALNEACDKNIPDTTDIENAKLKDLENELSLFDDTNLTAQQLALSIDNIDNNISAATTIAQLAIDIYNDADLRIDSDAEVEMQRQDRTFMALGLADLNATQRDAIYSAYNTYSGSNFEDDSIDDILEKMLKDTTMSGNFTAAQLSMFQDMLNNFELDHDGMDDDMQEMYNYIDYEDNATL